jgi:tricorn protease
MNTKLTEDTLFLQTMLSHHYQDSYMKYLISIISLLLVLGASAAPAQPTLLLQQPAISATQLAFVYAGDIWIADRNGAQPRRLTSSEAPESMPQFSPDGKYIAFAANHEGNLDIYAVASTGGQPRRLTWHPGDDIPTGWTADSTAVTMVSGRETDHGRSGQWYQVALDGGLPQKQMEARVYRGKLDASGERLAYIPFNSGYNGLFGGSAGWKGYRGGTTPAIQIMNLEQQTLTVVEGAGATNFNPLWLEGQLYFLSDRNEERFNLFHYAPAAGQIRQISNELEWDILSATGHGSSIVYAAGGRLQELDLGTGKLREIRITIAPDLPQTRPQWKDASGNIQFVSFSTTGKRVAVTARGEVFTVPVKDGSTRNITSSGQRREYSALWSPDGKQLAYIAESRQGQTLVIADQQGSAKPREIPLGPHFYFLLEWSGGERQHLVYDDNHLGLHVLDIKTGKSTKIATASRRQDFATAVSRDGRWLAYTVEKANYLRDLVLYNFETRKHTGVTQGNADADAPAFSPDGKYLYFAASTNAGPIKVGLNMSTQERPVRAGLYALVLSAEGESPLAPRTGDEGVDEEEDAKGDDEEDEEAIPPTRIDLDGLQQRVVALPVALRNYGDLAVGEDGTLYYLQFVQAGTSVEAPGDDSEEGNSLWQFDFEERAPEELLEDVSSLTISADGKQLLLSSADGSLATAELGDDLEPESLSLDGLRLRVDPRDEWALIFDETWRMQKEYFYAANMHGLDWQEIYRRYRPLLDHVGTREDLNTLLVEMIAELRAGHNRVRGGDVYQPSEPDTGLLGANLEIDRGRYRIGKIYTGETWNPYLSAPLAQPGNAARVGEYILGINGRELSAQDNIFAALQGSADQQVTLRVGPNPNNRKSRDIVVTPVDSESRLRLWDWVEGNRRLVDQASDGRVGYVYLPNTGDAGYTFFNRMFFPQIDKQALIIDERSNGGGQAADYMVETLARQHLSGWADRDGMIFNTPAGAVHGPKLMLIDQDAGSGGDFLPYAFRHLGIGTLMGTRTWGGLIGIATNPGLVDGGSVTVPFFRYFDPDMNWSIENEGVAPDIEVTLDPIANNAGRDSQLQAAITEILSQLETYRPTVPARAPALPTQVGE